jgi:hypothetical protein
MNRGEISPILFYIKTQFMKLDLTLEQKKEIELILEEASAWNVRKEVTQKAEKYIKSGHDPVDAYHFAYEDCTQQ